MLHTAEHIELMRMFERVYNVKNPLMEPKELWAKGHIYANGLLNEQFLAFRHGYAYGKCVHS